MTERGGARGDDCRRGIEQFERGNNRAGGWAGQADGNGRANTLGTEQEVIAAAIVACEVAPDLSDLPTAAGFAEDEGIGGAGGIVAFCFPLPWRLGSGDAEAVFAFVAIVREDTHAVGTGLVEADRIELSAAISVAVESSDELSIWAVNVVAEAAAARIVEGFRCDAEEVACFRMERPEVGFP